MNIGEAQNVQTLLQWLFPDEDRARPDDDDVTAAAASLADRAHKALSAGPTGDQVRDWFAQRLADDRLVELGELSWTALQRCRVCGCSDDTACPGGCSWVEADLCSACAKRCRVCGCSDDVACPGGCGWAEADLCTACAKPPADTPETVAQKMTQAGQVVAAAREHGVIP